MTKESALKLITEYVKTAEKLLREEYGKDVDEPTIEKLAEEMINKDAEYAEMAEAEEVMARAFVDEFLKQGGKAKTLSKATERVRGLFNITKKEMGEFNKIPVGKLPLTKSIATVAGAGTAAAGGGFLLGRASH